MAGLVEMRIVVVTVVTVLLVTATAHADHTSAVFLAGVTAGYDYHSAEEKGGIIGMEASVAVLHNEEHGDVVPSGGSVTWGGFYVDALYDSGIDHSRFSIGPEIGAQIFGVDAGPFVQTDGTFGFEVRPVLTVGIATLFYRFGHYLGDDDSSFHEFGIIGKIPTRLKRP